MADTQNQSPSTLFPSSRRVARLAACLGLWLCSSAWAGLGADLASVQADQQAFGASSRQTTLPASTATQAAQASQATLYTQTLANGVTLRQYLDAAGRVFAVGWDGPVLPDFVRLLGAYYPRYAEAVRQQKRGVSVQAADLVIESGGMMRAFSGRAYLPGSLPASLSAQDIR